MSCEIRQIRWRMLPAVICLAGFAAASAKAEMQPNPPNTVRVTLEQSGTNIQLHPGDKLEVTLPATFGTGYSWKVARSAEGVLKKCGGPETASANKNKDKEQKTGQTENQVFHFQASAEGTGQLELDYVRAWEKGAKPAKIFSLTVQVH